MYTPKQKKPKQNTAYRQYKEKREEAEELMRNNAPKEEYIPIFEEAARALESIPHYIGHAPTGVSLFKKLYYECDQLQLMFGDKPEKESERCLERRYKVVMTTILPLLLSGIRTIRILFLLQFGILGAILLISAFKFI